MVTGYKELTCTSVGARRANDPLAMANNRRIAIPR